MNVLDLGIELDKIKLKFIAIMSIKPIEKEVAEYDDMSGSILIAVILGILLLFVSQPSSYLLERQSSIQ